MSTVARGLWVGLYIDGAEVVGLASRIDSLEIEEATLGASMLRLRLDIAPLGSGEWDLLSDERFSLLRRLTVALGQSSTTDPAPTETINVFDGYITALQPTFSATRTPGSVLEIEAMDASCLMHLDERHREWLDKSDAEIAKAIFQEYGFAVDVEDSAPSRRAERGSLVQRCTDAEFLRQLARRNGFECWVEAGSGEPNVGPSPGSFVVGHFHLPRLGGTAQPALVLMPVSNTNIVEMKVRWESHRPVSWQASHMDMQSRRVRSQTIEKSRLPKQGKSNRLELIQERLSAVLPGRAGVRPLARPHMDVPHQEPELENLTRAGFEESDWLAEATVTVQGVLYPTILRSRRTVAMEGAGQLLDGTWYVRSLRHRWTAAEHTPRFETDAELVRNALGTA